MSAMSLENAMPTSTPRQEVQKGTRIYKLRMRNCSPWHTACSGLPHNALYSSSIKCDIYSKHDTFLLVPLRMFPRLPLGTNLNRFPFAAKSRIQMWTVSKIHVGFLNKSMRQLRAHKTGG